MRKHFKTHFLAANVNRLDETVATDTFFADAPAHDDGIMGHGGATMVQLCAGNTSQSSAVFPMQAESQMAATLEERIRQVGHRTSFFSDNAKAQIGAKVRNILRHCTVADQQSEPHHQHQNHAERRIQEVSHLTNTIMDRTGTPAQHWSLATCCVVHLLNHMAVESLDWQTPMRVMMGQQPEFRHFCSSDGGSQSVVRLADPSFRRAQKLWDGLWALLNTRAAMSSPASHARGQHSPKDRTLRSAPDPENLNLRASTVVMSKQDIAATGVEPSDLLLPEFSPDELLGQTCLGEMEDGHRMRARVSRKMMDADAQPIIKKLNA